MTRQQFFTTLTRQRQLLPVLLLTAYCIDAVITAFRGTVVMDGVIYNYALTIKHYIAFGAIGVNLLTYFFLRPFYKYILGLTVAFGLFNLMTFSALETTKFFSFDNLKLSFQPSAFWAGLLAYLLNFKRVNGFVIDNLATRRTPEEERASFAEGVEKFKGKYESYTIQTLTEILAKKEYVPEALEAVRQLLNERQSNGNAS